MVLHIFLVLTVERLSRNRYQRPFCRRVIQLLHAAISRRSELFSIAAIHFPDRSEAVIDLRMLRFSAWQAVVQRLPPFRNGRVTENPLL
jgi:hypothetical protein